MRQLIKEIHDRVSRGEELFDSSSKNYKVYRTKVRPDFKEHDTNHFSHVDGYKLEVRHVDNYFGSIIYKRQVKQIINQVRGK